MYIFLISLCSYEQSEYNNSEPVAYATDLESAKEHALYLAKTVGIERGAPFELDCTPEWSEEDQTVCINEDQWSGAYVKVTCIKKVS
jgi:hypothetical protein